MKNFTILFLLITGTISSYGDVTAVPNKRPEAISRALTSNDISQVIAILPEIEKLWPSQPETYFQCAREAALALSYKNDIETRKIHFALVNDVSTKACPHEVGLAHRCFNLKQYAIRSCTSIMRDGEAREPFIALSRLIGEIRSRKVADPEKYRSPYKKAMHEILAKYNQHTFNPDTIEDLEIRQKVKAELAEAEEQWRRNTEIYDLQMFLSRIDALLLRDLIRGYPAYMAKHSDDLTLATEIISAAKLTDEEQKKLIAPPATKSR